MLCLETRNENKNGFEILVTATRKILETKGVRVDHVEHDAWLASRVCNVT